MRKNTVTVEFANFGRSVLCFAFRTKRCIVLAIQSTAISINSDLKTAVENEEIAKNSALDGIKS